MGLTQTTLGGVDPTMSLKEQLRHQWGRPRPGRDPIRDAARTHWERRLAAPPPPLDLFGGEVSADAPASLGRHSFEVPDSRSSSLTSHPDDADEHCVGALAAFIALLYRHTGQADLIIWYSATSESGRRAVQLPLRVDLADDPPFTDLVGRVRRLLETDIAHSPAPNNPDTTDPTALSTVGFAVGSPARLDAQAPDPGCQMLFRLNPDHSNAARIVIEYRTDRFSESVVTRFAESYLALLRGTADGPEQQLSRLPILPEAELRRVLALGCGPAVRRLDDRCVHNLIAEQIARTPDAIAIEFGDRRLSYRELGEQAAALASELANRGAGPDSLVGLCLTRSPQMVVALLGILEAGSAYLPLDPAYPVDRLAFMLVDARLSIVVTEAAVEPILDRAIEAAIETGRNQRPELVRFDPTSPHKGRNRFGTTVVSPRNLAYVIYTSGSTGKPKGVMIEHGGLSNYLGWALKAYHPASGSGAPVQSPIGFDLTVTSLFLPLLTGRAVHLIPEEDSVNGLVAAMRSRRRYSLVKLTPAHLEILNHSIPDDAAPDAANALVIGGEQLSAEQVAFWRSRAPHTRLFNEYGPTETVVGCSVHEVDGSTGISGPIPIGRPIANTQIYVLDRHLQPCPIGTPGELCIGGAGVARGYLNRPELSAERFVADPYSESAGARMYRTGDLARRRDDGILEFLGRLDHQVKVRGFRIEPGEIETALNEHPRVRQSLVMVRDDSAGDRRLVGYVVLDTPPDPEATRQLPASVRGFLENRLPAYSVPDAIVILERFPLTENGKVDRKALPNPQYGRLTPENDRVIPRDETESRLVRIWEEELGIHPIGVTDDFFDLGVTSLATARLLARIEREFATRLTAAPVFVAPTIERMANLLRGEEAATKWTCLVPMRTTGTRPPLFCVHGGAGTVFHFRALVEALGPDQPFYALQARGLYGDQPPIVGIPAMAAHYINEIKGVQPVGPYYLGGHCAGGSCALEIAQQLQRTGDVVALVAMFNSLCPSYSHSYFRDKLRLSEPPPKLAARDSSGRIQPRKILGFLKWRTLQFIHQVTIRPRWEIAMRAMTSLGHCFAAAGWPIPGRVRTAFFVYMGRYVLEQYRPRTYAGRVIGFRSSALFSRPLLGWDGLLTGRMDIHSIDGPHVSERNITDPPAVHAVAQALRTALGDAHRAATPKESSSRGP